MPIFKRRRRVERETVQEIQFLGEQDGESERLLKSRLLPILLEERVGAAYLARVAVNQTALSEVALCLRINDGEQDRLAKRIGSVFASIFNAQEHLAIVFVRAEQEEVLRKVCRPFYSD